MNPVVGDDTEQLEPRETTGDTTYGFKVNTLEIIVPENFDPNKINLIIHEVLLALI